VSRINSIADIAADPQFHAREMIVEMDDERLDRPLLVPGIAPKLSRTPGRVPPLAQALGAATSEVRRQLLRGDGRRQSTVADDAV
jgi:formyl-CoA transferase